MQLPTGEWLNLPISSHFASEAFITRADVDWGSESLLFSLLERKGVFLDVGAHIGYYTLYVLPRVQEAYCFEPDPRVRPMLEQNIAGKVNVAVIPCAAGDTQGRVRFTLEHDVAISHLSRPGDDAGNQIVVDQVTIDQFVRSRGLNVEAIKIDAEGRDIDVIRGALNVLAGQQPLVLTEAKPDAALFRLMRPIQYRVFAYLLQVSPRRKWMAELSADLPAPGHTKMVFLVPNRLAAEFLRLAI
jgi:FkbM family methyltransferase